MKIKACNLGLQHKIRWSGKWHTIHTIQKDGKNVYISMSNHDFGPIVRLRRSWNQQVEVELKYDPKYEQYSKEQLMIMLTARDKQDENFRMNMSMVDEDENIGFRMF